ncbi:hypothetical protein JNUCC64_06820 [Streptomyces sp. JNUCC 64]
MTDLPARRARSWLAGCAVVFLCALFVATLAVAAFFVFFFPRMLERPVDEPKELDLAAQVNFTKVHMESALLDKRLTDAEIARAAGAGIDAGPWNVRRTAKNIRIFVHYADGPACYRFTVPKPIDLRVSVRKVRLDSCP